MSWRERARFLRRSPPKPTRDEMEFIEIVQWNVMSLWVGLEKHAMHLRIPLARRVRVSRHTALRAHGAATHEIRILTAIRRERVIAERQTINIRVKRLQSKLQPRELRDTIAQRSRALKFQVACRFVHGRARFIQRLGGRAIKKSAGQRHTLQVAKRFATPNTRRRARAQIMPQNIPACAMKPCEASLGVWHPLAHRRAQRQA